MLRLSQAMRRLADQTAVALSNILLAERLRAMYQGDISRNENERLFHETLGSESETNVGLNTGGGVKVTLVGPVRVRVDYRVFKLGGGALNSPAHRVYAGLTLAF